MKETFKPIIGRPGYMVSDLGRVLSLKRREPTLLSIRRNRTGYAEAEVFCNQKMSFINIGREVLAAFVGYPAEPWLCVAKHKNGDLMDCRLENLEWVICETDSTYDPTQSKRRGVLKPDHTKDRMTEAKYNQSEETIRKAVMSRKNTVELRKIYKKVNPQEPLPDSRLDEIHEVYVEMRKLNGK